jgi:hypothetical protein
MSISPIDVIIARIQVATPDSPLVVFRHGASKNNASLDCYFVRTVQAVRNIRDRRADFVGIYDNTMPADVVRSQLNEAVLRR